LTICLEFSQDAFLSLTYIAAELFIQMQLVPGASITSLRPISKLVQSPTQPPVKGSKALQQVTAFVVVMKARRPTMAESWNCMLKSWNGAVAEVVD